MSYRSPPCFWALVTSWFRCSLRGTHIGGFSSWPGFCPVRAPFLVGLPCPRTPKPPPVPSQVVLAYTVTPLLLSAYFTRVTLPGSRPQFLHQLRIVLGHPSSDDLLALKTGCSPVPSDITALVIRETSCELDNEELASSRLSCPCVSSLTT